MEFLEAIKLVPLDGEDPIDWLGIVKALLMSNLLFFVPYRKDWTWHWVFEQWGWRSLVLSQHIYYNFFT